MWWCFVFVCLCGGMDPHPMLFYSFCVCAKNTVLGERTAFFGSSQLMVFGGHDDGLRTYYNDAWLLRVKTETKADHERTEWYWQSTDLDGDADDNMQIPERRDGAGMVYLPSYVDFLSVTNTAYVHNTRLLFLSSLLYFISHCSCSSSLVLFLPVIPICTKRTAVPPPRPATATRLCWKLKRNPPNPPFLMDDACCCLVVRWRP